MRRKIGITQRVEVVEAYQERRDCLDQNWFRLLEIMGFNAVPLPNSLNDAGRYLEESDFDGFILSGGNDLVDLPGAKNCAPERDGFERTVLRYAQAKLKPVVGVCRGMQVMNVFLGGKLVPVMDHVAKRHEIMLTSDTWSFIEDMNVNSFHSWGVSKSGLGDGLSPVVVSKVDDTVEAYVAEHLPWAGIMWHPEREIPFKQQDIRIMNIILGESS